MIPFHAAERRALEQARDLLVAAARDVRNKGATMPRGRISVRLTSLVGRLYNEAQRLECVLEFGTEAKAARERRRK